MHTVSTVHALVAVHACSQSCHACTVPACVPVDSVGRGAPWLPFGDIAYMWTCVHGAGIACMCVQCSRCGHCKQAHMVMRLHHVRLMDGCHASPLSSYRPRRCTSLRISPCPRGRTRRSWGPCPHRAEHSSCHPNHPTGRGSPCRWSP